MGRTSISVLLDLDGTLVDSQSGIQASCRAALRALGHEPAPSLDLAPIIGPPLAQGMQQLLITYGDVRVTEAVAAYREHYGCVGLFQSTVYPGVGGALDQLAAAGATLYVATSKPAATARRILTHFGLSERLSVSSLEHSIIYQGVSRIMRNLNP